LLNEELKNSLFFVFVLSIHFLEAIAFPPTFLSKDKITAFVRFLVSLWLLHEFVFYQELHYFNKSICCWDVVHDFVNGRPDAALIPTLF